MLALEHLLRECVIALYDHQGRALGSGFFISDYEILTAAHVVPAGGEPVTGTWNGAQIGPLEVIWRDPAESATAIGEYGLPDLALLRLPDGHATGHPCVLLGDADPDRDVLAEGYSRGVGGAFAPDTARLEFESLRPQPDGLVIKLKDSIIDPGMSGGPLLDLASGQVVGLTKAQRGGRLPLGGLSLSARTIRDKYPDLWVANARFHQADRRWDYARLSRSSLVEASEATRSYLEQVRLTVADRPIILPPDGEHWDIHQIPSVRAERRTQGGRVTPRVDPGAPELSSDLTDGVMRWTPMQVRWSAVVLTGPPGVGKSYLLNTHADTHAEDSLRRLDEGEPPLSVQIPLIADCAALGDLLSDHVTRESVISALLTITKNDASHRLSSEDSLNNDPIINIAYKDGRLVTCLDALDEVGIRERQRVLLALPYLMDYGNRVVVTSRPQPRLKADTAKLAGCFRADVIGFSAGQVFAFARAWFAKDHGLSERFEAGLRERHELQRLAEVPLLAAFLCRLVSEEDDVRALPTSPAALYRAVVSAALEGFWRDPSRRAIAPDAPPDAALRLRILTGAVGAMTSGWRSRLDRFSVSGLDDQLTRHPDYYRAARAAEARLAAWHALEPGAGSLPPQPCVVRWEYMFDGLFAYDISEADEGAIIRFAHPVLGEYLIAAHIASLDSEKLQRAIDEHRWFDSSWEPIWPIVAALMPDPDPLIELFMADDQLDSWHVQVILASRCVVGGSAQVSASLAKRVVAAVATLVKEWRTFDRDRAVGQLGDLIRAGVPGSRSAARELLGDLDLARSARHRLAAYLAEVGDAEGLAAARTALADRAVPVTYRAWLARAVVAAEDREGIAELERAIKGARLVNELRRLVAAIPVETSVGGDLIADVLQDHSAPIPVRAEAGRALIAIGDAQRMRFAKGIAADPVTVWPLRAALMADLLAVAEDDLIPEAVTVLRDPNVYDTASVPLLENLIRRGEVAVLHDADRLIGRRSVHWSLRWRLTQAIAELGQEGIRLLKNEVNSGLPEDLKLRPLIALIESGEALDIANRIVADRGAPAWIRVKLICSLLEVGDRSIDPTIMTQLAMESKPDYDFQGALIVAMAARDIAAATDAAVLFLARAHQKSGSYYAGNGTFISQLSASGHGGAVALAAIANNTEIALEDRALAIVGLAEGEPALCAELASSQIEQFSGFVGSRLVMLLAEKGVIEVWSEVTKLLETDTEAYTALYKLLEGPRCTRELITQLRPFGTKSQDQPAEPSVMIKIDEDFLTSCGLTWTSKVQANAVLGWVRDRLELRVGSKLAALLTSNQLEEFEDLTSDEERLDFLASRASRYQDLVHEQIEALKQEILADSSVVPPLDIDSDVPVINQISYVANVVSEWLDTLSKGQAACAEFLTANHEVLASDQCLAVLTLAENLHPGINPYEGLRYIAGLWKTGGKDAAIQFIMDGDHRHNVFCQLLAAEKGGDLLYAGLAGILLSPYSASTFFYASLGAVMTKLNGLAIRLMQLSGQDADEDQREQGHNTIQRESGRLGWPEDIIRDLLAALDSNVLENPEATGVTDNPENDTGQA